MVGAAGSGRTGVLQSLADRARSARHAVLWIRPSPEDIDPCESAWHQALALGLDLPARPPVPAAAAASALAPGDAAALARSRAILEALRRAVGAQGLLLIDDADALPAALRSALEDAAEADEAGTAHARSGAVVIAAAAAPEQAPVWALPAVTATEVAAALRAACGSRTWDAGVVQGLADAAGASRLRVFGLAAALLRRGLVDWQADRVDAAAETTAETCEAVFREATASAMPADPALWPLLAHVTLAGVCRPGAGAEPLMAEALATARHSPLLRVSDGALTLADAAARAFVLEALPVEVVGDAAAIRAHAFAVAAPQVSVKMAILAATHGRGQAPAASAVAVAATGMLDAGELAAAEALSGDWLALSGDGRALAGPGSATVAALQLRALAAQGRFEAADAACAALDADVLAGPELHLARAELAFRRGDYPQCRTFAATAAHEPALATSALVWVAFAATWQGDREAARTAVAAAADLAATEADRHVLAYLSALGAYYAGQLDTAEVAFTALVSRAPVALRAAAAGGLGLVAHRRGDLTRARQGYDDARRLAEAAGDRPRALNMAMNAAVLDHEAGDLGRALQGYDRVVATARRLGNAGALARARNNRGNLLAMLGQDDRAADDLGAALATLQATGNGYLEGNCRCVLAELDRRAGRLGQAREQLAKAEAVLREAGAESERAEIQLEAAHLTLDEGHPDAAGEQAAQAGEAAVRLGSAELQARALGLRAKCMLDADPGTCPASADAIEQALDLLARAAALAPAAKPLLHAALAAEQARALAWSGDLAGACTLALDHAQRLARIAATLTTADRSGFERAAAHAQTRLVLRLLGGVPTTGMALGRSTRATLGTGAMPAVLGINRRLSGEHDLGPLLEMVMDAAVLLTGAERGFLLLDEEPTGKLRVAVARNLDRENLRKPAHKLSQTIALRVFETGERVLSTDAQADERFMAQASIHTGSLRSILCVPLTCQGRAIGVLYVDNRFTAGAFSAEHASVVEALADQAGIAIQTSRLIAGHRATAEALRRSQAEVESLNAQLHEKLAETASALDDARADLSAQRTDLARRSDYGHIKGESPALHRLFALMDRVRDHDFPVLVRGESGTGKELVARAIHFTGRRKKAAFVAVNCGALPLNLLESELFGHVRGAFTGALSERRGLFESAHGGTLLLDEVGEMPLEMQVRLLRVLQSGEIQRVGDSTVRHVDVRVVAATHRDLGAMVRTGGFREDLLYRLRVVEVEVPPLRQRLDDLPLLIESFLASNRKAGLGQVDRVSPGALARLRLYGWPGNIRQLETVLKSACLFTEGHVLQASDVEPLLAREPGNEPPPRRAAESGASEPWLATATLAEIESEVIRSRLAGLDGNKRRAAESLGIDRGTLYNKLRVLET